ncbi:MAG: hypothetical protein LBU74_05320 [Methanobacteriaceae archaeon]|jgi:hypothetical protein|nr:hypothetical protein [Candidatus Methanorudis spinitermitis]
MVLGFLKRLKTIGNTLAPIIEKANEIYKHVKPLANVGLSFVPGGGAIYQGLEGVSNFIDSGYLNKGLEFLDQFPEENTKSRQNPRLRSTNQKRLLDSRPVNL